MKIKNKNIQTKRTDWPNAFFSRPKWQTICIFCIQEKLYAKQTECDFGYEILYA